MVSAFFFTKLYKKEVIRQLGHSEHFDVWNVSCIIMLQYLQTLKMVIFDLPSHYTHAGGYHIYSHISRQFLAKF